jgi:glycosyltransferase involved in cell wall biosynthesis
MSGNRLTVIIPSRTQDEQPFFLRRSVKSVRDQTAATLFEITIIIAVDKGEMLDQALRRELDVQCVESAGKSQASALNAAIRQLDGDYVAFLEDDDRWQPNYLAVVGQVLEGADFISSNQMEFDADGNILRYLDFPTPSGWFMRRTTMEQVGEFNEAYRYHLDNEWLGRLNVSGLNRVHLVDFHVPSEAQRLRDERIDIYLVLEATASRCRVLRHQFPFPLVQRYVHPNSGMAQIDQFEASKKASLQEYENLKQTFGRIPT